MKKKATQRITALLMTICLLAASYVPAYAGVLAKEEQTYEGTRISREEMGEGSYVYFGEPYLEVEESAAAYRIPVFRSGDLEKPLAIRIRTLDLSALYGRDYKLNGSKKTVVQSDKTMLERAFTTPATEEEELSGVLLEMDEEGNVLKASASTAEKKTGFAALTEEEKEKEIQKLMAEGRSRLAAIMELETGEASREIESSEVLVNDSLTESILGALLPEYMNRMIYSCEQELSFASGKDTAWISFTILEDRESEGTEDFSIIFSDTGEYESYGIREMSVKIRDNEESIYSSIGFRDESVQAGSREASLVIKRENLISSIASVNLYKTGTDENGQESAEAVGTVVFTPYETEKSVTVSIEEDTEFELRDFVSATEGEHIRCLVEACAGGLLGEDKPTTVRIGGKDYVIEYDLKDTYGKLYDTSYEPQLEVGRYFFSTDTANGGMFSYGHYNGNDTKNRDSSYQKNSEDDYYKNAGRLYWYHSYTKREGSASAYIPISKSVIDGVYYQYLVPDTKCEKCWWGSRFYFAVNEGHDGGSSSGRVKETKKETGHNETWDRQIEDIYAVKTENKRDKLTVQFRAADEYSSRTPKSDWRFYGVAGMYKKLRFSVEAPNNLTYKAGMGGSVSYPAMILEVNCGAQVPYLTQLRDTFVSPDESMTNMVFTTHAVDLNGECGKFGKLVGYEITLGEGKDTKVKLRYPEDYISFLKDSSRTSTSVLKYDSKSISEQIKKLDSMDTIPYDKYFVDWLETVAKERKADGNGYMFVLSFEPVIDYVDVNVKVLDASVAQAGASFDDGELPSANRKEGKTFHAGDLLDLSASVQDSRYRVVGYQYSTDGGAHYTSVEGEHPALVLSPNKKEYLVRPLVTEALNYIEITDSTSGTNRVEIANLMTQKELETVGLGGKNILNLNPSAETVMEKITPVIGQAYTVSAVPNAAALRTHYAAVKFTDKMTGKTYGGNEYHFLARTNPSDNLISVSLGSSAGFTNYTVSGYVYMDCVPVRQRGIEVKTVIQEGYQVSSAAFREYPGASSGSAVVSGVSDAEGYFNLGTIYAKPYETRTLLVGNGIDNNQVAELSFGGSSQNNVAMMIRLNYPGNAPEIAGLNYLYSDPDNVRKVDLNNNTVRVFDDTFLLNVNVNRKGKKVKYIEFTSTNKATGAVFPFRAMPSGQGSSLFRAEVETMDSKFFNGDELTAKIVCESDKQIEIIDPETGEKKKEYYEVVYPLIDTGLVTYIENELIAPKEFAMTGSENSYEIPLIGKSMSNVNSGTMGLKRTNWTNGKGYSISVNLNGTIIGPPTMPAADKVSKFKKFTSEVIEKANKRQDKATEDMGNDDDVMDIVADVAGYDADTEDEGKESSEAPVPKNTDIAGSQGTNGTAGASKDKTKITVTAQFLLDFEFILNQSTGEYEMCSWAILVGGTFKLSKTIYSAVVGIPCFLNLTGSVGVNVIMGMYYPPGEKSNIIAKEFNNFSGNILPMIASNSFQEMDINLLGKAQVGVGMCGVLSARGFVSLGLRLQFVNDPKSKDPDKHDGEFLDIAGGIGFDILIGSIDFNIAKYTQGWGTLEKAAGVSFANGLAAHNSGASILSESGEEGESNEGTEEDCTEGIGDAAELLGSEESYTFRTYNRGTSDMSQFGSNESDRLGATHDIISKKILLEDASEYVSPVIVANGDTRFLAFIGKSENGDEAALYYAIEKDGVWTEPKQVEDDGTMDAEPSAVVVGDKVVLAWANANRSVDQLEEYKDRCNALQISGIVYDLTSGTFGEPVDLTKDFIECKGFMNYSPKLTSLGEGEDAVVYCTYVTRDLSSSEELKDYLNLKKNYMLMQTVSWKPFAKEEKERRPVNHINRVDTAELKDAMLIDYTMKAYKALNGIDYLVAAFTLDMDQDMNTYQDRELYLQYTDLSTVNDDQSKGIKYAPIRLSADGICQTNPSLTFIGSQLVLTWLEDTRILSMLDVTALQDELFGWPDEKSDGEEPIDLKKVHDAYRDAGRSGRKDWYVQTADSLGLTDSQYSGSGYEALAKSAQPFEKVLLTAEDFPEQSIESLHVIEGTKNNICVFYTIPAVVETEIPSGETRTDLYFVVYRDYVKSHASDARELAAYDGGLQKPVLIKENVLHLGKATSFTSEDRKELYALTEAYIRQKDPETKEEQEKHSLMAFTAGIRSSLTIDNISITGEEAYGSNVDISFDVTNNGMIPSTRFDYTADLKIGDRKERIYTSEESMESLKPGEKETLHIPVCVRHEFDTAQLIITVTEKGDTDYPSTVQIQLKGKEKPEVFVEKVTLNEETEEVTAYLAVENRGNKASEPALLRLYPLVQTGEGKEKKELLAELTVEKLASGERKEYTVSFKPELGTWGITGLVEYQAELVRDEKVIDDTTFSKTLSVKKLNITNEAELSRMKTGQAGRLTFENLSAEEAAGILRFKSSDTAVVRVDAEGKLTAVSKGEAKILAYNPKLHLLGIVNITVEGGGGNPDDDDTASEDRSSKLPSYVIRDGQWILTDRGWRYLRPSGSVIDQWMCIYNPYADDKKKQKSYAWFFFDAEGLLKSGWHQDKDGNTYYLNPVHDGTYGAMLTGWQKIDGEWYFFSEKEGSGTCGAMYVNTTTPDGYKVDEKGRWVK